MKFNFSALVQVIEANVPLAAKLLTPAGIAGLLKAYNDFKAAGTVISVPTEFLLADDVLAVLETAGVTIAELRALVASLKPLFVTA